MSSEPFEPDPPTIRWDERYKRWWITYNGQTRSATRIVFNGELEAHADGTLRFIDGRMLDDG